MQIDTEIEKLKQKIESLRNVQSQHDREMVRLEERIRTLDHDVLPGL